MAGYTCSGLSFFDLNIHGFTFINFARDIDRMYGTFVGITCCIFADACI